MKKTLFGMSHSEFSIALKKLSRANVDKTVADIYKLLCCDDEGEFDDESSLAADSAAEFVDACNQIFEKLKEPNHA